MDFINFMWSLNEKTGPRRIHTRCEKFNENRRFFQFCNHYFLNQNKNKYLNTFGFFLFFFPLTFPFSFLIKHLKRMPQGLCKRNYPLGVPSLEQKLKV